VDSIHEKIRLSEKLWDKKRFELALPYHLEMVLELFAFCYGGFDTVIVLVARDLAKCNCASYMEALLDIRPHIANSPPPSCVAVVVAANFVITVICRFLERKVLALLLKIVRFFG
jgi:hypothetical protein